MEDSLDREKLRRNLDRLSGPQRQAITPVFDEGYTIAEAALILNIPAGTVKSRIRAAVISSPAQHENGLLKILPR